MSRENDVCFSMAFGDAVSLIVTLADLAGVPVDVTGYTARLEILRANGTTFGAGQPTITSANGGIVVGTTNGRFTSTVSAAQSAAIAAAYGSPPPVESARYSLYVTPPSLAEKEIGHGEIRMLESGAAVSTVSYTVHDLSFTVSVTALAPAGPEGPDGPVGPQGAPGEDLVADYVIPLSVTNNAHSGLTAVDGSPLVDGQTVLDASHATAASRGLFRAQLGAWPWASTYDTDAKVAAALKADIRVTSGTLGARTRWAQLTGTTLAGAKSFAQIENDLIQVPRPSGDTSGVTDQAILAATIAKSRILNIGFLLAAGVYHYNATLDITNVRGWRVYGRSRAASTLYYVGPRSGPGIDLSGSASMDLQQFAMQGGASEWHIKMHLAGAQPSNNNIENISFNGDLIVRATSTASLVADAGPTKVFTGVATGTWPVGTQAVACSRGNQAQITGVVASYIGTTLTVTVTSFYDASGGAAHIDWDLWQPTNGLDLNQVCQLKVVNCTFACAETAVNDAGGFGTFIDSGYNQALGYQFRTNTSSQKCRIKGFVEPGRYTQHAWAVQANTAKNLHISMYTGDNAGGTWFDLTGCDSAKINEGVILTLSGPEPVIKAVGCPNLKVKDNTVQAANASALVDFGAGSASLSPDISGNTYLVAPTAIAIGNYSGQYYVEGTAGDPAAKSLALETLVATTSVVTGSVTAGGATGGKIDADGVHVDGIMYLNRVNGAMTNGGTHIDQFWASSYVELTGPTGPVTLRGLVPAYEGHEILAHVGFLHVLTISHLDALELTAARKLTCEGAVDLVSDGGPDVWFYAIWDGTNWRVRPLSGFNTNRKPAEFDNGTSGAAKTIAMGNLHLQKLTMSANCTLTITDPGYNCSTEIRVIQDTTPRTLTLPGSVKTPGGVGAVLSAGSGAEDIFVLERIATATYRWTLKGAAFA